MSSTDDAFIKAFHDRELHNKALELSKRQSYIVGNTPQPVTEYLAGVTKPVALPKTGPPPRKTRPHKRKSTRKTINDAAARPNQHTSKAEGNEGHVELRMDSAVDPVVPPPHTPISAFSTPAEARPVRPAAESEPHPIRPRPPQPRKNRQSGEKVVRIERAHQANPRARKQPKQQRDGQDSATRPASGSSPHQAVAVPPTPTKSQRPTATLTPAWEVDAFHWPSICCQLGELRSEPLIGFVQGVLADAWQGNRVIAVTDFTRGEGSTTLALCLARWAAMFTGRVALVDGDIMQPRIADSLGLSFARGWEELSPHVKLSETSVYSVADRLVVVPLGEKSGLFASEPDPKLAGHLLGQLSSCFELVVVDAGPMFDAAHHWFTDPTSRYIQGALVVQDVRRTSVQQVMDVRRRLAERGIERVSVVENFQESNLSQLPIPQPKIIR